jgi:NADH dehydrogenase
MKQNTVELERKQIVILGGGFAGVRAALDLSEYLLDRDDFEIILVDRKDFQLYHSALYEAATTEHGRVEAKLVKRSLTIPLAEIFGRTKVKMFRGFIDRIDLENGKVITDSRIIYFDYLVIAMGSIADFYGIPNIEKHGFTLKSLEDAVMIRNRVEDIVLKKDSGQIVIGGAGFAGVEFVGELHNLLRHECVHHHKELSNFKLTMVEGSTEHLPGLSPKVSLLIARRLEHMGVETHFSTLITDADKASVVLNNKDRIACDLLIWTGGVRSCRLPATLDLERDKKDRTFAAESLNLKKFPNVFLAGDNLCFMHPQTKKPVAQTAQEAIRQGRHVARNVFRMISRKDVLPYTPGPVRFIIPVAGKFAILYTPNLIISGFLGWCIRRFADLRYFMSVLPFFKALQFWLFENRIFTKND